MITLQSIHRYPVKSTRGETLASAEVTRSGILLDRRWMIAETTDQFANRMVTGRNDPKVVRIEARVADGHLNLSAPGMSSLAVERASLAQSASASVWRDEFTAWTGSLAADAWLSEYVGRAVRLMDVGEQSARHVRNRPDVPLSFADGFPLLLINTSSVDALSEWVGRAMPFTRFRPNLLVTGAEAFAEDGWKRLRIGEVEFTMAKRCSRCVFTTVDPETGEKSADQQPLRALTEHRRSDDGVMFGVNLIAENTGSIAAGATVEIIE
ncbi:MOSC domain-containing protein [Uliginosibacterium sp. sgz301328]|uniref:MOSC domain-containing protein n=1 Tax=Uliginosibacterium sp. sgz301328 TaxID=3243764 RepID=UPI00359EC2E8